jgi:hypothetical protein
MNIVTMTKAVEHLDASLEVTFDPHERAELETINMRLRKLLQKRGVFVGGGNKPPKHVHRPTQSRWGKKFLP